MDVYSFLWQCKQCHLYWNKIVLYCPFCLKNKREDNDIQKRIISVFSDILTSDEASDITERADRLLEEVLELLQSKHYDFNRIDVMKDYVRNRPIGNPHQEAAGIFLALINFCEADQISLMDEVNKEINRIEQNKDKIRKKQKDKSSIFK